MLRKSYQIFRISCRNFASGVPSKPLNSDNLLNDLNLSKCFQCLRATNHPSAMSSKGGDDAKYAAVLIPLCVSSTGQISILFTRRSGKLSRHTRQISFPGKLADFVLADIKKSINVIVSGGLRDHTDTSYEETALRETEEEIGIRRRKIKILGHGSLLRPMSTASIMPIIGQIENLNLKKDLKINKDEVDEAFTIEIKDLIHPDCRKHTQFKTGPGYSSPVFIVNDYRIWGITAYITNLFLNCLLPNEFHYDPKINFVKPYRTPVEKSDF